MIKICELWTLILWYELNPRVRCAFGNVYFLSSSPPGKGIPWLIPCFLYILNPTAGLTWKFWIICFPLDIYQILDEYIEYCNVCWYSRIPSQTKPWSLDQLPVYQSVTCYIYVEWKTMFITLSYLIFVIFFTQAIFGE